MRAVLLAAAAAQAAAQVTLSVDTSAPLNVVDDIYVSYNIDTGSLFNGLVRIHAVLVQP